MKMEKVPWDVGQAWGWFRGVMGMERGGAKYAFQRGIQCMVNVHYFKDIRRRALRVRVPCANLE